MCSFIVLSFAFAFAWRELMGVSLVFFRHNLSALCCIVCSRLMLCLDRQGASIAGYSITNRIRETYVFISVFCPRDQDLYAIYDLCTLITFSLVLHFLLMILKCSLKLSFSSMVSPRSVQNSALCICVLY